MSELNSTTSHFIRCIKPNQLQVPSKFDNTGVMTQLRYNGMCTALELMQYGFPTRIGFEELYARYVCFCIYIYLPKPTRSRYMPVRSIYDLFKTKDTNHLPLIWFDLIWFDLICINRYSPMMPLVISKLKPITFCEAVLVALDLHGGKDFQMGLTKVLTNLDIGLSTLPNISLFLPNCSSISIN